MILTVIISYKQKEKMWTNWWWNTNALWAKSSNRFSYL